DLVAEVTGTLGPVARLEGDFLIVVGDRAGVARHGEHPCWPVQAVGEKKADSPPIAHAKARHAAMLSLPRHGSSATAQTRLRAGKPSPSRKRRMRPASDPARGRAL